MRRLALFILVLASLVGCTTSADNIETSEQSETEEMICENNTSIKVVDVVVEDVLDDPHGYLHEDRGIISG